MVIEQLIQFSPLPRKGTLIDRPNCFPHFFKRAIAHLNPPFRQGRDPFFMFYIDKNSKYYATDTIEVSG